MNFGQSSFLSVLTVLMTLSMTTTIGQAFAWGPNHKRAAMVKSSQLSSTIDSNKSEETSSSEQQHALSSSSSELGADSVKTADVLSLDSIRSTLIRQEETIIFAIIERAQFRQNSIVYQPGGFGDLGLPVGCSTEEDNCSDIDSASLSFLEYMLIGTEALHCGVRRYTSPEEHAFFPNSLPKGPLGALPQLDYPTDLLSPVNGASSINFNPILLKKYIQWIVPSITKCSGDDEQHGSTVLADIALLQALSRRCHYGKFVAESKYLSDPEGYQRLVDAGDADGVMELLTNVPVEEKVLRRARLKAATYGREPIMTSVSNSFDDKSDKARGVAAAAASAVVAAFDAFDDDGYIQEGKIDPKVIEDIYRKFIIPLTKDIEVAYLFLRCGKEPPAEYAPDRMSRDFV